MQVSWTMKTTSSLCKFSEQKPLKLNYKRVLKLAFLYCNYHFF